LYRNTSLINQKPRTGGFSKLDFLENLLKTYKDYRMIFTADNCDEPPLFFS